jgi:capsular exopolysaccharide synthesis family protein
MGKVARALERAAQERRGILPDQVAPLQDGRRQERVDFPHALTPEAWREYERLATEICQRQAEADLRTLMLTSCLHGEGTTTVAINLAHALAERGNLKVLLVDANFRHPALDRTFGLDRERGLSELIAQEIGWEAAARENGTPNLYICPAGKPPATVSRLFEDERFGKLLEEFRSAFDLTLFDAAPLLPYVDALPLAAKVDSVMLVVQVERTREDQLTRAREELEKLHARIYGVVLNRKRSYGPRWLRRHFDL